MAEAENCSHECSSCGVDCPSRQAAPESLQEKLHEMSSVKKVIGIVSGKGGVGKSLVTCLAAVAASRAGKRTAILDADVTGPSIPRAFGITEKAQGTEYGMLPAKSRTGIDIMSVNLLLEKETDPVIWRGPVIAGVVKQFWSEVIWLNEDIMFVDMPPGTGDVPLTVFQSLPVDGVIVVTSPQDLVAMIVNKAVAMAEMMKIPVLGIVENMSYLKCPDCQKEIKVFGDSHIEEIAAKHGLEVLARIPIDPRISQACDQGRVEDLDIPGLEKLTEKIL